jgi:hypothetical protein
VGGGYGLHTGKSVSVAGATMSQPKSSQVDDDIFLLESSYANLLCRIT